MTNPLVAKPLPASKLPSKRPSKLPGALALAALTLVFCHNAIVADAGSTLVIVGDSGHTGHHDAGVDSGVADASITQTIPDASVMVTSLAPTRGSVAGGTPVTILGGGFLSGAAPTDPAAAATATRVTFGGNPVLNVLVLSDDELQVSSPPGTVGVADVDVTNPNGSVTCTGCYDYLTTIEIDSVSPGTGPLKGGTPITVTGLGFDSSTVLTVGGRGAIGTISPDAQHLTATTPPGNLAGRADVRTFNQNGSSLLYGAFTYVTGPTQGSLSPVLGPIAGGTTVTLTGSGFLGEQVTVTVGGNAATQVAVLDDATITFVTPAGAVGQADVVVTDVNGTSTLTGGFVYYDPASSAFALLGVVPSSGPAGGSSSVSLVGTGFPATFTVTFGSAAPVTATSNSPNLAAAAVPAGTPGPVAVSIVFGATTSTLSQGYTYLPAREITSITPASGPSAGGTSITVDGMGFVAGDQLFIGPEAATNVKITSTEITALTPPGSAGPNDVLVVDSTGSNPALLASGFNYLDPLSLVQIAPTSGSQSGGTYVELLGTGFTLGDTATFGSTLGTDFQLLDAFTLACYTPVGAPGPVDVTVNAPANGGSSTLKGGFSYYNPGSTAGGQSGGPLDGTLNVTVLSAYNNAPIPGAGVVLGLDPATPFQGFTDANGQITFSDQSLVKAQTVTVTFSGLAVTIDNVTQQNLTVLLNILLGGGPLGSPCLCSNNGEPIDCPDNCGLPFCGAFGSCVQCLEDVDCTNPNLPNYDPAKPHCEPPGGIGGSCVHCVQDSDCANDPNGNLACDDARGTASTFECVQCNSNPFCTKTGQYCDTNNVVCINADLISGNVFGFKVPDNITVGFNQHVEARVGVLEPTVFDFEPFNPGIVTEAKVPTEGGEFSFQIDQGQLDLSLYAKFGIVDDLTNTFTPLLLGLARGISVDPQHPATNVTILLDTHLDQSASIQVQNELTPPPGGSNQPVQYDTFSFLDLGADGVVPLSDVVSSSQTATLGSLPPIQGNGLLFLTQAFQNLPPPQTFPDPSQRTPFSVFFRQVDTDFTQGVQIGPLLPFVQPIHPVSGGVLDGTFQWSFAGSIPAVGLPDLTQIQLVYVLVFDEGNGQTFQTSPQMLWQIVVPGSETQVQVPPAILSEILQEVPTSSPGLQVFLLWAIDTAKAPRFDYSFFSYTDLNPISWTSFQATEQLASP